jgi:hypothetical protein
MMPNWFNIPPMFKRAAAIASFLVTLILAVLNVRVRTRNDFDRG